jgi:hypothetical protein
VTGDSRSVLAPEFTSPDDGGPRCSDPATVHVVTRGHGRPGRAEIRLRAVSSSGPRLADQDRWMLVCKPRKGLCPVPATTTTTMPATTTTTTLPPEDPPVTPEPPTTLEPPVTPEPPDPPVTPEPPTPPQPPCDCGGSADGAFLDECAAVCPPTTSTTLRPSPPPTLPPPPGPTPYCGDLVRNQPVEACDGSDDSACPAKCTRECLCEPAHAAMTARVRGHVYEVFKPLEFVLAVLTGAPVDDYVRPLQGATRVHFDLKMPGVYDVPRPTTAAEAAACRRRLTVGLGNSFVSTEDGRFELADSNRARAHLRHDLRLQDRLLKGQDRPRRAAGFRGIGRGVARQREDATAGHRVDHGWAAGARPIAQARLARRGEPAPPLPHGIRRDPQLLGDACVWHRLRGLQHNPRPQGIALRGGGRRFHPFEFAAIRRRQDHHLRLRPPSATHAPSTTGPFMQARSRSSNDRRNPSRINEAWY